MTSTDSATHRGAEAEAAAGTETAAAGPPLAVAPALFAVGLAGMLLVAVKLVVPGFLDGSAALSYGRLFPMAANLVLWGWLAVGAMGAAFFFVPRIAGTPLRLPGAARVAPLLVAGGAIAGVAAVAAGGNAGGRLLELPWWADAVVIPGLLAAAASITATLRAADRPPVSGWYFGAASWWMVLGAVTGAVVPLFGGLHASLVGWFAVTVLTLGLAASGIGAAYALVERLEPEARFHPRLGQIGFWSLVVAWAWTAPRVFQYGPTPDWLETVPVAFSLVLVVAVTTIAADLSFALRGRWDRVVRSLPLTLTVLGVATLALVPLQMVVQNLRTAGVVVHFTAWEAALESLTLFGPVTLLLMAVTVHAAESGRRPWGTGRRRLLLLYPLGLGAVLVSRWMAGLQQGYTWVGGVNSRAYPNSGVGFRNSVTPLEAVDWVQVAGLAVMLIGAVVLAAGARAPGGASAMTDEAAAAPPATRFAVVLQGVVLMFAVALAGVVVVPIAEAGDEPSLLAERSRDLASEADAGREVYLREGCWYCHTQQVRAAVTDVGLGAVSLPGDFVFDPADLLGVQRIGPDLAHVAARWAELPGSSYLADPRGAGGRPWSTMPAYGHLSDRDLENLSAYLASLE